MSLLVFSYLLYCNLLLQLCLSAEHSMNGTVYFNEETKEYSVKLGIMDCVNGIVCGYFNDSLNKTGWSVLEIKSDYKLSSTQITDYNRMFAAGILEGYLSSYEIYWGYYTGWQGLHTFFSEFTDQINNWTQTQRNWMNHEINKNGKTDPYWYYVNLLTAQFDGLYYGYNNASNDFNHDIPNLNNFQFQFINSNQDLIGVITKIILDDSTLTQQQKKTKIKEINAFNLFNSRCSGLIKVSPEFDNIFISHSTWTYYFWMNRIYKHYIIKTNVSIPQQHMTMSSYPGALSSLDDFYIMDSGLAVIETTNGLPNIELFELLSPQTLFAWQRARIANALANNGRAWVQYFSRYNSGTFNNQWMVLNYKLFQIGEPLKDDTLWIAEQIPGNISSVDVTNVLKRGYWGSYNLPSIEYIYKESGAEAKAKVEGVSSSYDLAPRARIMRRDANNANNMTMMKKLTRYNNYLNDPLQNNNPKWAMMDRSDLLTTKAMAFGGIDTKIADINMMQTVSSITHAGPTSDNLPIFTWNNEQWINEPHTALPQTYDFEWVNMNAKLV